MHPKSSEESEKLVKLFTHSFLTKNLDTKERKTLADAMFAKKFAAGESIIRYGDIGSEYFVLT